MWRWNKIQTWTCPKTIFTFPKCQFVCNMQDSESTQRRTPDSKKPPSKPTKMGAVAVEHFLRLGWNTLQPRQRNSHLSGPLRNVSGKMWVNPVANTRLFFRMTVSCNFFNGHWGREKIRCDNNHLEFAVHAALQGVGPYFYFMSADTDLSSRKWGQWAIDVGCFREFCRLA